MSDVVGVSAVKEIHVKSKWDDPDMDVRHMEIEKNLRQVAKRLEATNDNVYLNRAGQFISIADAPDASEYEQGIEGTFGWKKIGKIHYVPFILRSVGNENLRFVSVRMAVKQLFESYTRDTHLSAIYNLNLVECFEITEREANLLNYINQTHCDQSYGKDQFIAGRDMIVGLQDIKEFYQFVKDIYFGWVNNVAPGIQPKCGYIRIDQSGYLAYCIKDDKKYFPISYFEGEAMDFVREHSIVLENWSVAYIKYCCMLQHHTGVIFNPCLACSLDDLKKYFPSGTKFEDSWPYVREPDSTIPCTRKDLKLLTMRELDEKNNTWLKRNIDTHYYGHIITSTEDSIPSRQPIDTLNIISPPSSPILRRGRAMKTIMRLSRTREVMNQFRVIQNRTSTYSFLREKIIRYVDAPSYVFDLYSDFIVTIQNLAQKVFPECTAGMCFSLLYKYLKCELRRGNTGRLEMMRKNGHFRNGGRADEVSLAELIHINLFRQHFRRLTEQGIQECIGPPAKRPRLKWNKSAFEALPIIRMSYNISESN